MFQATPGRWIRCFRRPVEPTFRLVCLPHAGGSVAAFNKWPQILPSEIQVCAVQLPGRGDRFGEPLCTSFEPLVDAIAVEAIDRLADIPYALFGHSVGALIAFELCRSLRRKGGPAPKMMFVAGRRAPGIGSARPELHTLPDSEFLSALAQFGGIPTEAVQERELMELFLPVLRADLEIDEKYTCTPEAPLACPISVFGGKDDATISRIELEAWSRETSQAFSLRLLDGGHFFVETSRAAVLAAIEDDLTGPTSATVRAADRR